MLSNNSFYIDTTYRFSFVVHCRMQSGRIWVGIIKPSFQTTLYNGNDCSNSRGPNIEFTNNSTQCLYLDLSDPENFDLADCQMKYPFVCFSKTRKLYI